MPLGSNLARTCFAITPSDTTKFNASAIYVGGAGTVIITPSGGGSNVTFTVPAGGYVLCGATRVMAASTATGLVGLAD